MTFPVLCYLEEKNLKSLTSFRVFKVAYTLANAKGSASDAPLGPKIFSISCTVWEHFGTFYEESYIRRGMIFSNFSSGFFFQNLATVQTFVF